MILVLGTILYFVGSARADYSYDDKVKLAGCQNPVTLAPEMTIIAPAVFSPAYDQNNQINGEEIIITIPENQLRMVFVPFSTMHP